MKRTVLVFGASGFIGRHFFSFAEKRKLSKEYSFVAIDRLSPDIDGFEGCACDCLDAATVLALMEERKPDFIIDFIGSLAAESLESLVKMNFGVAKNILDAVKRADCKTQKILLIGSAAEMGMEQSNPIAESAIPDPTTPYGLTKFMQSCLAMYYHQVFDLPIVVARTFNLSGAGASPDLSIGNFERQISSAKDGDTILTGDLSNRRDFMEVDRAVAIYWELLMNGRPGEIYNVCSGSSVSVQSVLDGMVEKSGKRLGLGRDPHFVKSGYANDVFGDASKLNDFLAKHRE